MSDGGSAPAAPGGHIPAEATEAAAAAIAKMLGHPNASIGQYHRDFARMVLEAAAPRMTARACRDGRQALRQEILDRAAGNRMVICDLSDLLGEEPVPCTCPDDCDLEHG